MVSTETKIEIQSIISEQKTKKKRAKTYKVSPIQTVLLKKIIKTKHNINLPLFVFTNTQKEEMKKIIVLNTSDLNNRS